MKKILKIITILLVILVVFMLAALLTLKIMFPAEKLKSMAQQYVQNNFHREITFSGVSWNLVGVTLNDFALSEKTSFQEGTFLKADQAVLKLSLKPLFKKRLEISTIGLQSLEINVTKDKTGAFNFDDLLNSTPENQPSATETNSEENFSMPFVLLADHIYAQNCNLNYQDLQEGTSLNLNNLDLDIRDFDLDQPFKALLSFTTTYQDKMGMNITVPLQAQTTIDLAQLNMSKAYATLDRLEMNYKNIRFSAEGKVENFEQPALELQGKISGISNKTLSDIVPDMPAFGLPDITFRAQANADLDSSTATLKQLTLAVKDSALTASGTAGWGGENPTYNINTQANLNLTQIAAMTELLDGFGMSGIIKGNLTATDKKDGQDVRGTVILDKLGVQYDPVTLSDIQGTITIASLTQISAPSITGKLNGESFTTSFTYKDLGKVMDINWNLNLSKLILDHFPSLEEETATSSQTAAASTPATSTATEEPEILFNLTSNITIGEITIPYFTSEGAQMTTQLTNASPSMKRANGTVSFSLKPGAIKDLGSFVKGSKVIRILMLPLTIVKKVSSKLGIEIFPTKTEEEKGQIKFSSGSGSYVFTQGVMNIQETHFDSALSKMTAKGSINFPTEALEMFVTATVLTSQTPIVIKIGGTLNNPSGKLDVAKTAVSLVGGILNYKTPTKAASSTVHATTGVSKAVANTGEKAVKNTVSTAASAVKSIGSLFKKNAANTDDKKE